MPHTNPTNPYEKAGSGRPERPRRSHTSDNHHPRPTSVEGHLPEAERVGEMDTRQQESDNSRPFSLPRPSRTRSSHGSYPVHQGTTHPHPTPPLGPWTYPVGSLPTMNGMQTNNSGNSAATSITESFNHNDYSLHRQVHHHAPNVHVAVWVPPGSDNSSNSQYHPMGSASRTNRAPGHPHSSPREYRSQPKNPPPQHRDASTGHDFPGPPLDFRRASSGDKEFDPRLHRSHAEDGNDSAEEEEQEDSGDSEEESESGSESGSEQERTREPKSRRFLPLSERSKGKSKGPEREREGESTLKPWPETNQGLTMQNERHRPPADFPPNNSYRRPPSSNSHDNWSSTTTLRASPSHRHETVNNDDYFHPKDSRFDSGPSGHSDSRKEYSSSSDQRRYCPPGSTRISTVPLIPQASPPANTRHPYGSRPAPLGADLSPNRRTRSRDEHVGLDAPEQASPEDGHVPNFIAPGGSNERRRRDPPQNSVPNPMIPPIPPGNQAFPRALVSPPTAEGWTYQERMRANPYSSNSWQESAATHMSPEPQNYAHPSYNATYYDAPNNTTSYNQTNPRGYATDMAQEMATMSINTSSQPTRTLSTITESAIYEVTQRNSVSTLPDIPRIRPMGNPKLVPFQRHRDDELWRSTTEAHIRLLMSSRVIDDETLPLWYPKCCGPRDRRNHIEIGDLGYLDEAGEFHRVLNVFHAPPNELPLRANIQEYTRRIEIQERHSYLSDRIKREDVRLGGSLRAYQFFVENSKSGGIVMVPHGGVSACLQRKFFHLPEVKNYFRQHAASWYQHAITNDIPHVSNGSLLLVRGVHVARTWGIAAFSTSRSNSRELISATFGPTGTTRYEYLWETRSNGWKTGRGPSSEELKSLQSNENPPITQCFGLVVSSLKLDDDTWSANFASKVRRPVERNGLRRFLSRASSMSTIRVTNRPNNRRILTSPNSSRDSPWSDDYELLCTEG